MKYNGSERNISLYYLKIKDRETNFLLGYTVNISENDFSVTSDEKLDERIIYNSFIELPKTFGEEKNINNPIS